ncbi:MAG TPA: hypothetical protein VFE24_08690, partial [Pirellulales bacterium]|nr:hypothetical protein [Pirellulales bacterium]
MLARTLWRSVLTMVVWSLPLLAGAEDFHVETDLYNDGSKTAASTDTTIFFAGRVYDFLTVHSGGDHTESLVTICDPQKGRIVLLDPERKMKVELERDRLVELSGSLRTWAAVQNDALLKFS